MVQRVSLSFVVVPHMSLLSLTVVLREAAIGGMNVSTPSTVSEHNAVNAANAINNPAVMDFTQGDDDSVSEDPYHVRLPQGGVLRMPTQGITWQSSGVIV